MFALYSLKPLSRLLIPGFINHFILTKMTSSRSLTVTLLGSLISFLLVRGLTVYFVPQSVYQTLYFGARQRGDSIFRRNHEFNSF